jgi:imidazolonepropionase-like amidohydrolase
VTILPGLIDIHVHISYHFGADGRASNRGELPQEAYYTAENAYTTLMAGFTTVQRSALQRMFRYARPSPASAWPAHPHFNPSIQ